MCEASMRLIHPDHLLCLNRGSSTGHEWFERTLGSLEDTLVRSRLQSEKKQPLVVHIWWGWQDGMVPRQGQGMSNFNSGDWVSGSGRRVDVNC